MAMAWGADPEPTRDSHRAALLAAEHHGVSWLTDLIARLVAPWRTAGILDRIHLAVTHTIPKQLTSMEDRMAAREDADYQQLNATIATVKDALDSLAASNAAKDQQIAQLQEALATADADAAARLSAALDADSEADADKIEAANAALAALVAPAQGGDDSGAGDDGGDGGEATV